MEDEVYSYLVDFGEICVFVFDLYLHRFDEESITVILQVTDPLEVVVCLTKCFVVIR